VKRGKRAKFIPFQGPPTKNGVGSVLKLGGANLHFEVRLRGKIIISKIKKKYQRISVKN
jgi:hypothetical protein